MGAYFGKAPRDYTESFLRAGDVNLISKELAHNLAPSAGLRNVIVHDYAALDFDILASSIPKAITQYESYVREVAQNIPKLINSGTGGKYDGKKI